MHGRLTLSQWLTRPDGLPTLTARLGVVALMGLAATAGYAAAPERSATASAPRLIAASELAGDLPIATPEAPPALQRAHAVPALRGREARRRTAAVSAPAPVATPVATATPEPEATATPAPSVAPVAVPPAPAPAPRPRSTPAPTFDLSG